MTDPFGTHTPFLTEYAKRTTGDIVEFGTGKISTPLLYDIVLGTPGRKLLSYENDPNWIKCLGERHEITLVENIDLELIRNHPKTPAGLVFIDNSPWKARCKVLDVYKNVADIVIVHDADYFPKHGMFGKTTDVPHVFDFSDVFLKWELYMPDLPWPSDTGPPTLVGTNNPDIEILPRAFFCQT